MKEEDIEFNAFLKSALEAPGAFSYRPRSRASRWKLWSLSSGALIAASFAILLSVVRLGHVDAASSAEIAAEDGVENVIGLFAELDEVTFEDDLTEAEDLLLAWQDAPMVASLAEL